jgi:low affinity Fe/Cu permease
MMNEQAREHVDQAPRSLYSKINDLFRTLSQKAAAAAGSAWAFILAITVVVLWAATGAKFRFSDTWQLIINTGTTIVTFLIVFLIQKYSKSGRKTLQLKLNELIRAMKGDS